MRTLFIAAALGAVAVLGGQIEAQAQSGSAGISGVFQTQPNDEGNFGMVQFAPCGDRYCGTLVRSFNASGAEIQSPHTGRAIVANMVDNGGGSFSGGTIWDPNSDRTYKSKMTLSGSTLKVSGCVSVICRNQTWTKLK